MIEKILIYRKYILLLSQVAGILICTLFMIKANQYEISTNVFSWFFPGVSAFLNQILSSIRTYILIIPLTIITLSMLIAESMALSIAASFFGIASTLFVILSGILRNTLTEVYNMKLLVITKILTLEQKKGIFKLNINECIEKNYHNSAELYQHLKNHFENLFFDLYLDKLNILKDRIAIELFADSTTHEWASRFKSQVQKSGINNSNWNWDLMIKIGLGIGAIVVLLIIVKSLSDDNLLKGANLNQVNNILSDKMNDQTQSVQLKLKSTLKIIQDYIVENRANLNVMNKRLDNNDDTLLYLLVGVEDGLEKIEKLTMIKKIIT